MRSKGKVGKLYGSTTLIWNKNTTRKTLKPSDPLTKANQLIDWEIFRKPIKDAIQKDITKEGRPPYDAILMYKITILQQWYGQQTCKQNTK